MSLDTEVNDTRVNEQEEQDKKTYENQKKIKQIFKDNQKNPFLFNDVNTALDWKHSNPLVVTVKSPNRFKKIKNFVLNAGEHECCFHFIKNDIVTRCKLTNKLVGIDMDFYRSCNPDGQTAKLIDYYHSAGNIPREFMFRRQYFCWTHLSLLTGVRPKIVHSENPDGNLETKLFAVSMIPADTVFACFCNYRTSRKFVRTVFQKEPSGGDDTMPQDITEMPYTVGKNDSFYFNLFFRDIADYAVADDQDSETKEDEKGNNIYNALLDKYKLVIKKDNQNTTEIQYIRVDEKDNTAQDDFIDDIWALKAKYDIYGGHGEENHVEIKYHANKIEIENIKLQYYGNNIASNKKGKPQLNSDINVDELKDNVKIDGMKSYSNTRNTGNNEKKEVIDNDKNSKNNKCPFVFLLFCKNTKKVFVNAIDDYEKGKDITKDDIAYFLKKLNSLKEPNLEIIFFLQKEGQKEGVIGKNIIYNIIYFLYNLFKTYNFESILNTVTPDEYRSLKHNFLNVYPEHNYQFNYIRNKQYETCGSIIKYFRLAQNYYTPYRVSTKLMKFFTLYNEAVSTKINHKVEGFDKKQYNENIDMITHVAFSEMPYFKNFREELNIVVPDEPVGPPSQLALPPSPPPPLTPPSLPTTTVTTTASPVTTTTASPVTTTTASPPPPPSPLPTTTVTTTTSPVTTTTASPVRTTMASPVAPTTASPTAATTLSQPPALPTATTTSPPSQPSQPPQPLSQPPSPPSPPQQLPTPSPPPLLSPQQPPPQQAQSPPQLPVVTASLNDINDALALAFNDEHTVNFPVDAIDFSFDAVPTTPYTNIDQNCTIPIPGQLAIIDSCTEDMWRQNNNDCFLDSFLFATFATKKVSDIFNRILVAIRNNYRPLYDAFKGYLDLHGKSNDNNYQLCKQKYKNSIYNCLFEISTAYRNDLSDDTTIYNNKLNDRLKLDLNEGMLFRMSATELRIIPENKRSLPNLSTSNLDSLLYFFELVTLLFPNINTKIYYKYSSNYPDRNGIIQKHLKPFFDTNYYDCIIYIKKEETFTKSFFQIESEFNRHKSNNYEINSIIVPCAAHVVAFNTEMCNGTKKYFYYNNTNTQKKTEIQANVILNNILNNRSCLNATIIATKKTTQQ